jgi:hypothetical protein
MGKHEVEDLSRVHARISELFQHPQTQSEWDTFRLSDEQLLFYRENGYISGIKLLEEWQIDRLNDELEQLFDANHPGNALFYEFHSSESSDPNKVLFHALGAWRITAGFHDVLWNPAFLVPASQLLGGRAVRFWHDQLFCKPALHGGVVAWHQDYSYWTRTKPIEHLTCWVGLDDSTQENGCLQYIEGSHRWGLLDKPELAGDMEGIMDFLTEQQKGEFRPVPIELKQGYATFHHPLLVHGSYENSSERSRRAFVLNVFADGVHADTDEPLLAGTPAIGKGRKMEGQFHPLLYDPVG